MLKLNYKKWWKNGLKKESSISKRDRNRMKSRNKIINLKKIRNKLKKLILLKKDKN